MMSKAFQASYLYIPANFLEFQRVRLLAKPKFTGFFTKFCAQELFRENIKSETFVAPASGMVQYTDPVFRLLVLPSVGPSVCQSVNMWYQPRVDLRPECVTLKPFEMLWQNLVQI